MEHNENGGPELLGQAEVRAACGQYREAMIRSCLPILGNMDDAEDATDNAIVNALSSPPDHVTDLRSWLCVVARNDARDTLRRRVREARALRTLATAPTEAGPDELRELRVRLDAYRLVEKLTPLLSELDREWLDFYLCVALGGTTERQLAENLGIPPDQLKDRRRRAREAVRGAAVAVCLMADPGEGDTRCAVPYEKARVKVWSPRLLRDVQTHVGRCGTCRGKQADRNSLLGRFLAITGPGLLVTLADRGMSRPALGAAAVAAVALTISSAVFLPAPDGAAPEAVERPRQTSAAPTVAPETTSSTPFGAPPARPEVTRVPPSPRPSPPAPAVPEPAPSPPADEGARSDRAPLIGWSTLEHRRIATPDHEGGCGEKPTTSAVVVHVASPRDPREVTVLQRVGSEVVALSLINAPGTRIWYGEVGPFDDAGREVEVSVRAVAPDGTAARERIGTVCVTRCRRDRGREARQ